jgi:hypothetical protein
MVAKGSESGFDSESTTDERSGNNTGRTSDSIASKGSAIRKKTTAKSIDISLDTDGNNVAESLRVKNLTIKKNPY